MLCITFRNGSTKDIAIVRSKDGQLESVVKSFTALKNVDLKLLGVSASGSALTRADQWSFDLRALHFGPATPGEKSYVPVNSKNGLAFATYAGSMPCPILKDGKPLLTLPTPPGDAWTGGAYPAPRPGLTSNAPCWALSKAPCTCISFHKDNRLVGYMPTTSKCAGPRHSADLM